MANGIGWRGRGSGLIGALDRFTEEVEQALDRAAAAVVRRVGDLERKMDGAGGPTAGHDGAAAEPRADEARFTAEPGPQPGAEPPRDATETANDREGAGERSDPDAKGFGRRYAAAVDRTREGVTSAVSRGAGAIDGVVGDAPWRMAGLDGRRTRIAREVMRDVVPRVAGERVASVIDGAALKGGVAGAGLLLRVPLKGLAVPFLLGVTAVETVRAVRDVRRSVADVAARVDNEGRSEAAYRAGA